MAAERASQTATVLFTDLVGSTELMSALGDSAFDDLRADHFARLAEAVTIHRGQLVKNTGDGILATFGSAVDGLHAAVALQQATHRQAASSAAPLALRVGLSLGETTFEAGDVFGTPVVEAARLVGVAQSGQILCSALVRMVAGGRADLGFTDLGPLELKGLPEPVVTYAVAWEPPTGPVPLPPLLAGTGRIFVGRDGQLERCLASWKEATAGERRVAMLAGEPGIGKTRLASEVGAVVHAEGCMVLAGRCDEDMGVPYQPFVEALRQYAAHAPEPRLGRHGGELVRLVPEVADRVAGLADPLRSDPETERYRLFDAVTLWLADVSAETPVLLVLDDLHWAARPTLLLLRHVLRSSEPMRLLVVVTYRDTDIGRGHPLTELLADLRRERGVDRLSLTGLDRAAVAAYIEAAAGYALPEEDDEAFVGAVWEETEGNPFFVAEVVRHLSESGAVVERDGRWVLAAPVDELGIPEGVRDVVGRRLSRLSEDANRTLAVASVVGVEFELSVVVAAGGVGEDEVFSVIEEALAAHLVVDVAAAVPRNRFAHALVRATLYDELSAGRRVALHRRVAEAIEALHAGRLDDHLPALAHHFARAGAQEQAIDYNTRAGDRALGQLAHDEAVVYYHQALELLEPADKARRAELLIALGEAQRRAGDPSYRETLLDAGRLARDHGDVDAQARAALANQRGIFSRMGAVDQERVDALGAALDAIGNDASAVRARLLASLAVELHYSGDERPLELGREALTVARGAAQPAALADVLAVVWFATRGIATPSERSGMASELSVLAEQLGDPIVEFHAAVAVYLTACEEADMDRAAPALTALGRIAEELGQPILRWRAACLAATWALAMSRFEEVERLAGESLHLGEVAGQPDASAFSLSLLCVLRFVQGRPEEATQVVESLIERFPGATGFRCARAWFLAETGRLEEARAVVAEVRGDSFSRIPREYNWMGTMAMLSRAVAGLGQRDWADELYALLLPHRSLVVVAQSVWFGPLAHDLGQLAAALGRHDQADGHFAVAAEVQARIGARGTLIHTQLAWARMLVSRRAPGDMERAEELVAQARDAARQLGLPKLEERAVALGV